MTAHPPRRGVAMLLVLGMILVATVLGYAMLSHGALTQQVSTNSSQSALAQGMAESGVNLAIYYLQNPSKWKDYPAYPANVAYETAGTFWAGTNGQFVDFGTPSIGSVKVQVTRPVVTNRWLYEVVAVGRSPGSTLERRVEATVYLDAEYKIEHAAMFTNDVTLTGQTKVGLIGQTVGDVYSNGGLVIRSGGSVLGRGFRRKVLSTAVSPSSWQELAVTDAGKIIPLPANVKNYQTYEYPKGTGNTAAMLTGTTEMGSLLGIPLDQRGPTTGNAAGVYIVPGNLRLKAGTHIDGTLIVQGNAIVEGTNVYIRSKDGMPALIVTGNLTFSNLVASTMNVEGLAYVGGRVDAGGLIPTFNVTGALLVGGANPIFLSSPLARLNIVHDPARIRVPDFSEVGRTPTGVRVIGWQGQ